MRILRSMRLALGLAVFLIALVLPAKAARTHVVAAGETLSGIADKYDLTSGELARANRLKDTGRLRRGQRLIIPEKPSDYVIHHVERGESLSSIASRYGVTTSDILAWNTIRDPGRLTVGQTLRILEKRPTTTARLTPHGTKPVPPATQPDRGLLPAAVQTAIHSEMIEKGRWKNIVVHHSATDEGSGKGIDRYHREERHMENGLAYHFVIGNGNGMEDGEIFIGERWKKQLDGGHLAIPALNANSLGICLVGDFQKQRPTRKQMDALDALVRAIMRKTGVRFENLTTHQIIHPSHTKCPGKNFPFDAFKKRLKEA